MKAKKKTELCVAKVCIRKGGIDPHTIRCQKPSGHTGAHESKRDAESHLWFGPAVDSSNAGQRFRFGTWLEAGRGW